MFIERSENQLSASNKTKTRRNKFPDDVIKMMIAESYDLITDSPTKRIYEAVKKIPKGQVATYADVAEMAGDRKMARAVATAPFIPSG